MWIDTGELVRLVEKVDEAEGVLAGSADMDELGAVLGELRKLLYRDIALADNPSLAEGKAGGGGKKYGIWKGEEMK